MDLDFDEDAKNLIISAKDEMQNLKHPYVGSEHLFLAILKNKELEITKTLNKYQITYKKFYDELVNTIGFGNKTNNWFLFTPMLKRIINNASLYTINNLITPYSLLISLFQEGDGIANRILWCLKIDIDSLYEHFIGEYNYEIKEPLLLDQIAINMNEQVIKKKQEPIYGRDEEINNIIQILLRKNKNNPLLLGEAGVGKTAIVEELARRIVEKEVPLPIQKMIVYNLSMSILVSGTKYRGEFEEKFQKIIKEATNNSNIILFVDEIHTIIGAGGAEGAIDASNIIKPYLARNDLRIIGATTINEYYNTIEKDKALVRRFHKLFIKEPTSNEVKQILLKLKPNYERFHHVKISNKILDDIIYISNNFLFYEKQPDKAIDLLDEVCTYCVFNSNLKNNLKVLVSEAKELNDNKNRQIQAKNIDKALILKEQENNLVTKLNQEIFINSLKNKIIITKNDLNEVLFRKLKISKFNNYKFSNLKLDPICKDLIKEIKNINILSNNNPYIVLLNGEKENLKKDLVHFLVRELFDDDLLISIDLNNYFEEHHLAKIINNSNIDNNFLVKIKNNPFSIIFIENIDKCHYSIYDYFLNGLNEGYFVDAKNNKYYIKKSFVFLTTRIKDEVIGFTGQSRNYLCEHLNYNKFINVDKALSIYNR